MPHDESLYPADWLLIAEKDWKRVERILNEDDPEMAGFYLQQAVEKFLKAFLLSQGWQNFGGFTILMRFLTMRLPTMPLWRSFVKCVKRSPPSTSWKRYPFVVESGITEEDVRISLKQVKDLVEKLRAKIAGR